MYYEEIEAFCRKFDRTEKAYGFRAESIDAHRSWKEKSKIRLKEISGLIFCESVERNGMFHSSETCGSYFREYWTMETEPGITMPFYLLRPANANGAAVICLHGHGGGKETTVRDFRFPSVYTRPEKYRDQSLAEKLAEIGFFVLCPDERGSGERREVFQQGDQAENWRSHSHRELMQIALGFGQSVVGLAVWDLMCLVSFAQTIPEIDHKRIGCSGFSGGGHVWCGTGVPEFFERYL